MTSAVFDCVVYIPDDLLDLMKDDSFRKTFPGLTIIDPAAFLANVRAEVATQRASS